MQLKGLFNIYSTIFRLTEYLQPIILFLFRIYWGWQFFLTGKGKLFNHNQVVEFFTSLGIPLPGINAWFVAGVESIGGILLLVGLFSKPVALVLAVNMLVAYISVPEDRSALFGIFKDPEPFLSADPFFFLLTSILVLAFGAGAISIDYLIQKRR